MNKRILNVLAAGVIVISGMVAFGGQISGAAADSSSSSSNTAGSTGSASGASTSSSTTLTSGDYVYRLYADNRLELTKYNGTDENVIVPSELGGNPVTSIGSAFQKKEFLKSITIPASVNKITLSAFSGSNDLSKITINSGNTIYTAVDNIVYEKDSNKVILCAPGISEAVIKNGTAEIGSRAFYMTNVNKVHIPASVTKIYGDSFSRSSNLKVFDVDTKSTSFSSANGILYNKNKTGVIACGGGIDSVTLPNTVTAIGERAFVYNEKLSAITIPSSVKSIAAYAFEDCRNLTSITIPSSVTVIEKRAFDHCDSLKTVKLNAGITTISEGVFNYCKSLQSINIPSSVTSIGSGAFSSCKSLQSVNIPSSVTTIENRAFRECTSLQSINIPSSVTTIERDAFINCTSLKSLTVPKSVTTIGDSAIGYNGKNKIEGFTLYCYKGSAAQTYAISNGINYVLLDGTTVNYGDVNMDKKVDMQDLALLQQYLAKWDVTKGFRC